jgi:hypothetical protein
VIPEAYQQAFDATMVVEGEIVDPQLEAGETTPE